MSIDISLIPQERIKDLVSTLDTIQNNLSNSVVHKSGNETISGDKNFLDTVTAGKYRGNFEPGYGGFEYASAYSADTIKYGRLASILINGTYQTNEIQFMVQQTNKLPSLTFGEIKTRVHDTAGTINLNDTDLAYTFMPKEMVNTGILNGLKLYYWNNFATNQAKVEIWIENPAWTATTFSIIDTISVNSGRSRAWTFYHNDMYDSFPTDATGYKQARLNVLSIGKPTEDTTSSIQADTVGARNTKLAAYSLDSSVVHKTGDESINGTKTFNNAVYCTNSNAYYQNMSGYTLGTVPSSNYYPNSLILNDSKGQYFGFYGPEMLTDGSYSVRMGVRSQVNSKSYSILKVGFLSNGSMYTSAPTPPASDNSTNIATTNWCYDPAKSTNLVHRSGNETINGKKTFTGSNPIVLQNNSGKNTTLTLKDSTTSYGTSAVDFVQATSNNFNQLLIHFQEGNKWCTNWEQDPTSKNIKIYFTGSEAVFAPTPATSDNSTKIATTNWSRTVHPLYPNITTSTRVSVPANTDYSIPYDCWVWWGNTSYVGVRYLYVNGIEFGHSYGNSGHWEEFNTLFFPIKVGNVIRHTGGNSTCFLYQNVY